MAETVELEKQSETASIMLEDNFRRRIITEAIKKAGSMRQLGKVMGYKGSAPNWSIKQILEGKQGIRLYRLEKLCRFMGLSLLDVENKVKCIRSD